MILHRSTYRNVWPYGGLILLLLAVMIAIGWGKPAPKPAIDHPYDFAFSHLKLEFSQKALFQIRLKRSEALKTEVLTQSDWGWVPGTFSVGEEKFPIKARLKGDFTDHLKGGKWSFRIKIREDGAWKGMKAFSLQTPETRGGMKEWLFHRVLEREGFLTTHYDFVRLSMNGTDWGIYALEEHFGKELIERNQRKEGPILKLSETSYWATRTHRFRKGEQFATDYPVFESMHIEPFQAKKTLEGKKHKNRYEIGQNQVSLWKKGEKPAVDQFEINQMARFFALVDVFRAYHCLFSHNLRMYYNPVTTRLEPIAFDAYDGTLPIVYQYEPYIGYKRNSETSFGNEWDPMIMGFWADSTFSQAYVSHLQEVASEAYWESLQQEFLKESEVRTDFLRQEVLRYELDWSYFEAERTEIRDSLFDEFGS